MSFEEKYQRAIKELESTKILQWNYNPPLIKLLHQLGAKVPPPHYNSFFGNTVLMGGFFGITWGLVMYLLVWTKQQMPVHSAILLALGTGLFFGVTMAAYFKFSATKNKLTQWRDL